MDGKPNVPTVLAVDDDEGHLELFEIWLEGHYRVRTATGGSTALERFDRSVDVVLLDRNMPGLSGDEVLTRLRRRPGHCRVVMVTGESIDDEAIPLPFDDYLVKPVTREELEAAVERALDHANYGRLQDELYTVASRIAILETHIDRTELADNGDYRALKERFDELQAEFESLTGDFEDWEYWNEFERNAAAGN